MSRGIFAALAILAALSTSSAAFASDTRTGVRKDNDPNSVPPPEVPTAPTYQVDAPSPCNGHYELYNTYEGNNNWDLAHGVTVGCSVPTQITCTSILDFATARADDTVHAGPGAGYCSAYRYQPGTKMNVLKAQDAPPFEHIITFTITLSPPYYWQYTTFLCPIVNASKRVVTCRDTTIGSIGFNHLIEFN